MKKVLVIDDLRTFTDYEGEITYARNPTDAWQALLGPWDEVFLDHDLGEGFRDDENPWADIRPFVNMMVRVAIIDDPLPIGQVFVCTDNPPGRDWIIGTLEPYYPVRFLQPAYRVDWEQYTI